MTHRRFNLVRIISYCARGSGKKICFTSLEYVWSYRTVTEFVGLCIFQVGTIGGTYVAAILIHSYKSWHPVFYCFGIASIVWSFLFVSLKFHFKHFSLFDLYSPFNLSVCEKKAGVELFCSFICMLLIKKQSNSL